MPTVHAKLSASGAKRWIGCPASVALEEAFPDKDSVYTLEGTKAHSLAECRLAEYFKVTTDEEKPVDIDGEMDEKVEEFVTYVIETYNAIKKRTKERPIILLEQRLDFSPWVPEGFGTGDVVIIAGTELHILDLKYGKGVPVDAVDNPQLRLYAIGAYNTFEMLYDLETVTAHIGQPRLDSYSKETLTVEALLAYANDVIAPAAQEAWNGSDKQCIGDYCGFCKALGTCKAQAEHNLALAQYEFASPTKLTNEEIADILTRAKNFTSWLKAVETQALNMALAGDSIPGFKVVEGRSNRKYTDPDTIVERLVQDGFEEPALFERKLLSLTNMEKLVGKKHLTDVVGDLIEKPPGKPALVPVSDKRSPMNVLTAQDEFENLED